MEPKEQNAFEESFSYLLADEGGFVNNPKDAGHATNMGITIAVLSEYFERPATVDEVKNLSVDTAKAIYLEKYWKPLSLDLITDPLKACAILDIGVLCGVGTAAHMSQEASKCGWGTFHLGQQTADKINAMSRNEFISAFEAIDEEHFEAIAKAHDQDVQFLKGWIARARRLLTLEKAA